MQAFCAKYAPACHFATLSRVGTQSVQFATRSLPQGPHLPQTFNCHFWERVPNLAANRRTIV